jgi:hypothetical protein
MFRSRRCGPPAEEVSQVGVSTDALLVYGFPVDEDDVPEGEDPWEQMEDTLLRELAGFSETWSENSSGSGFFERKRQAEKMMGVEIVGHCSNEATMYFIATSKIRAWRGSPEKIETLVPGDDVKLRAAAEVLGIKDPEIGFWLASWWG